MKIVLLLILIAGFAFFISQLVNTREEIKSEIKESLVASGDTFIALNQKMIKQDKTITLNENIQVERKVLSSHFTKQLENSLSPEVGENEELIETLEKDPEKNLKELSALLVQNPHSLVWNNALNILKAAKIDPDQKIMFLKKQLKLSGSFTDDEEHNTRVLNQYHRLLGTLKEISLTESIDISQLADEIGRSTPPGDLQETVKSILYRENQSAEQN